mgnify:CR=1 FL=1
MLVRPTQGRSASVSAIYVVVGLLVVGGVSVGLSRLKPAAPTVERAVVWPDTVKRGNIMREVRGLGTLTPEDIRWIPATTQGRVEKIILRPGTQVKADSVILELTNPQLEQQLQDAELKVQAAIAALENLKVQLQQRSAGRRAPRPPASRPITTRRSMQAQMNEALREGQAGVRPGAQTVADRRRVPGGE